MVCLEWAFSFVINLSRSSLVKFHLNGFATSSLKTIEYGLFLGIRHLLRKDYAKEVFMNQSIIRHRIYDTEVLRKDYLFSIGRIIACYEELGHYARCIEFAEKYLAVDRYAEAVYRSLMISYWKTEDKFKMARTFQRCRDNVTRELSCGLSEETELLYRELLRDQRVKVF